MAVFSAIICERTNYVVTLQHHSNDTQRAFRKNARGEQKEHRQQSGRTLTRELKTTTNV